MINSVVIAGRLTREPELRVTDSGFQMLKLCVAVNDRRKDERGEWADYPMYFDGTMYGKRAESLERMLHKGQAVTVQGSLDYRTWTGKDGSNKSKIELKISEIFFEKIGEKSVKNREISDESTAQYATENIPF